MRLGQQLGSSLLSLTHLAFKTGKREGAAATEFCGCAVDEETRASIVPARSPPPSKPQCPQTLSESRCSEVCELSVTSRLSTTRADGTARPGPHAAGGGVSAARLPHSASLAR
jgi:hypothetical protein